MSGSAPELKGALASIIVGDYDEAIRVYTRMITNAENQSNVQELSLLYSYRGGFYFLAKQYQLSLQDCDRSMTIDPTNVVAYVQKAKTLVALRDVNTALEVLKLGRSQASNQKPLIEYEKSITRSWFTLGHIGLKFLASIALAMIIGTSSGMSQAIIVGILSLFVMLINLREVFLFISNLVYMCRQGVTMALGRFSDNQRQQHQVPTTTTTAGDGPRRDRF